MSFIAAIFYFVASFLIAVPAQASPETEAFVQKALERRLDGRIEWRRLVHYTKSGESQSDNPRFFLAPDGKTNPRNELIETLRQGFTGGILPPAIEGSPEMSAICQFPARWKWLKKELGIPDSLQPASKCERYDEYIGKMRAKSVTVVFSAYYVNNTSTMYGHVLFRLNKSTHGTSTSSSELLDSGVSYAANMTTQNPLLYSLYGLIGKFKGVFTVLPYYYKVREYSDAESRDLWNYDLALSQEEVDRLVDHLWEMGSTYFDYFYLTENCAYHVLSVLEAAAPRLNLISRMPYFVIPVDSVKALTGEPGLVERVTYRPSTLRQLEVRYASLNSDERSTFLRVRNEDSPADHVGGLSPDSQAHVLDAVLDDIDHRHYKALALKTDPTAAARKQNVLIARSRLPAGGSLKVPFTDHDRPDKGHRSTRWSLGVGYSETRPMIDGEYRFALHSIDDPLDGYLKHSSVEMGRFRFRAFPSQNKAQFREFSLFSVTSLAPITRLTTKMAWRMDMGFHHVRDQRCGDCAAGYVIGNMGASVEPFNSLLLYTLLGPTGETGPEFNGDKWIGSLGARAGIRWKPWDAWQLAAEGEWRRVYDRETFDRRELTAKLRWDDLGQRESQDRAQWALELEFKREVVAEDYLVKYLRYF